MFFAKVSLSPYLSPYMIASNDVNHGLFNYPGGITSVNLSTANLAAGVCVIQAHDGKTWATSKFVKQ